MLRLLSEQECVSGNTSLECACWKFLRKNEEWLTVKVADRFAEAKKVSEKMLRFAYEVGKGNRPGRQTAAQFARERLDALGMGHELTSIPWGSKKPIPLPPSGLKERSDVPNK